MIVEHTAVLEFACTRCPRWGRYRVSGLIARYGAGCSDFIERVSADCPRRQGSFVSIYELCGAHCPTLVGLFR